ncbi:MAG: hypothetical protein REI96_13385, partial [Flavobacterium nitrogenifigens]
LHEEVVSFYDAVVRSNLGLSVINKNHELGWDFQYSLKKNELFIFPSESFNPQEIDLLDPRNYHLISPNIYRVQKFGELGSSGFWFRHHLETNLDNSKTLKSITYKEIYSHKGLEGIVKVRINHLGKIVQIGEY